MRYTFKLLFIYAFFLFLGISSSSAQYTSTMVKTKHQAYTDSLKQVDYTYTFPIAMSHIHISYEQRNNLSGPRHGGDLREAICITSTIWQN